MVPDRRTVRRAAQMETNAVTAEHITRRGFLKALGGAAAAPYVLTSAALGAAGRPPASDRLTAALIGCGSRGGADGGGLLAAGAQLVAACDCQKARREGWANRVKGRAYADFREVLARDDIDVVGIATPDHWHVPIAVAAARAGKDVYCEKPLGVSIREDQLARDTFRRYGAVFQFGTQWRSYAHCRIACELVRSGRLGHLREINVFVRRGRPSGPTAPAPVPAGLDWDMWLGPAPWRPYNGHYAAAGDAWWYTHDFSLGFMAACGVHPLDQVVWAFDTHTLGPFDVEGTGAEGEGANDTLVQWNVRFTFPNGTVLTLRSTDSNAWHDRAEYWQFVGTEGRIEVDYARIASAEPASLLKDQPGPDDVRLIRSSHHPRNFLEAARSRGPAVADIEGAFHADVLCQLADIAVRSGRRIRWDPAREAIVGDAEASRMMSRPWRAPWAL